MEFGINLETAWLVVRIILPIGIVTSIFIMVWRSAGKIATQKNKHAKKWNDFFLEFREVQRSTQELQSARIEFNDASEIRFTQIDEEALHLKKTLESLHAKTEVLEDNYEEVYRLSQDAYLKASKVTENLHKHENRLLSVERQKLYILGPNISIPEGQIHWEEDRSTYEFPTIDPLPYSPSAQKSSISLKPFVQPDLVGQHYFPRLIEIPEKN